MKARLIYMRSRKTSVRIEHPPRAYDGECPDPGTKFTLEDMVEEWWRRHRRPGPAWEEVYLEGIPWYRKVLGVPIRPGTEPTDGLDVGNCIYTLSFYVWGAAWERGDMVYMEAPVSMLPDLSGSL